MAVIPLEVDVSIEHMRHRLEQQWSAAFRLRRALQRDAQHRCRAYSAANRERCIDAKGLRERLGLTRTAMAVAAKEHIEASRWMRDHLTKAVGFHLAGEVWESVDRHLFADTSGRRHGPPRIGSWWDFTRIPGRARSHTKLQPAWETWRLTGTLDGHLAAYRHPDLLASVTTATEAADWPDGTSILAQPPILHVPERPAGGSWWDHDGALAVVFTGLPGGDLVLPVRLPQGSGQWARLGYFLADPKVWHKIDLVRVRDRRAPGGWRYYAHLLTHQGGYQSRSTRVRRAATPAGRRAGIDANVSNLSVASVGADEAGDLIIEQVGVTAEELEGAARDAKRARARQRSLERSRRNSNPNQYLLSTRQRDRAARRAESGLRPKQVTNPGGPRHTRAGGVPVSGYRHDQLSRRYQKIRADHATQARTASRAKHVRARQFAARIVAAHGSTITVEDCNVSNWARFWGKRIQLFSPGMLIAAVAVECRATGGQLHKAATRWTAMSQHCLCGARVGKTLAERIHDCPVCGLRADRDVVSAVLAACVKYVNPDDPATARVDYKLASALRAEVASQQEARVQSTGTSPHRTYLRWVGQDRQPPSSGLCWATRPPPGPPPNRPVTNPDVTGTVGRIRDTS